MVSPISYSLSHSLHIGVRYPGSRNAEITTKVTNMIIKVAKHLPIILLVTVGRLFITVGRLLETIGRLLFISYYGGACIVGMDQVEMFQRSVLS